MTPSRHFLRASAGAVLVAALAAFAASAAGCGEAATGARGVFEREVAPVLEARCAGGVCHGVAPGEAGHVGLTEEAFILDVDGEGRLTDLGAAYVATRRIINTVEDPRFSSLLRKPLPLEWGGTGHAGGDNFTSPEDPAFRALRAWIELESEGGEDPEPAALTDLEQHFADEVQPVLFGRSCGLTNCHGPAAFPDFRLQPGLPDPSGRYLFSIEATRANYEESRRMLALDGDPTRSRLLTKALPLDAGGIRHRGGNRAFLVDEADPAIARIVEWATREQRAIGADTRVQGVVFVRGPIDVGSLFDAERFVPGTELMILDDADGSGTPRSLTGTLLGDAVDIRDPAVTPDADAVVFALRRSEAEAQRLVVLDLERGDLRQLTDGPVRLPSGRVPADVMPTVGPDGFVYFASNRHDVLAERQDALDLDLYRVPLSGGTPERLTFTPSPEREPATFSVGPFRDYVVFDVRRAVGEVDEVVGFSFPFDRHVDYHVYFGITPDAPALHQLRELPDGRAVGIASGLDTVWGAGALVVVDRNLGPDLAPGADPAAAAVPGYIPTLAPLLPDVAWGGGSFGGVFRDPAPLPDGTVLASWTPGPIDAARPDAPTDFRVVRLSLDEAPDGCTEPECGPRASVIATLADAPGEHDHSPVPIVHRARRVAPSDALDPSDPSVFGMVDIVVNDAVMAHLPPEGVRAFRDDVVAVRFVEALPRSPARWSPVPPEEVRDGEPTASAGGNVTHMPARVLGEVPLEDDASLYVTVPPETPFRTQLLDADGMAVGVQHNRWLYVWPGQDFNQSTHRDLYDQTCGGCHGASTGAPQDVSRPPDVTTRATLTLSRYQDRNPRVPREPVALGDSTRRAFTFDADVGPMLERACADVGCHDMNAPGGLTLVREPTAWFDTAYESLLQHGPGSAGGNQWVDQRGTSARASLLMELLLGRELEAPGTIGSHPPIDAEPGLVDAVIRWIETGAAYRVP